MYAHPFSADYWRDASREVRDLRKLLFSALMIALCIVLAQVPSVPLFGGAKVTWGFLARSVCAWVCGPVLGLLFAFAEDILSFFLTGGGGYPFFPGYTLTTMLGVLTYALFLYRAPPAGLADLLRQAGHQCAERGAGGAVDRHSQQQRPLQPGGLVCQRVSQRGEKPHHAAGADGAAGASAAGAAAGPSADGDAAPAGGGGQAGLSGQGDHVRRKTGRGRRPVFDLRSRGKCSKIRWHLFTICLYPSVDNEGAWW